jgi:phosphoribosyl 1,2-cyclic phosphodiesterase
MPLRFTVLASGSGGNASLLEADGFFLLVDAGLGPRQLASRLQAVGASWREIRAVLLTHTHSDHWKERTLIHLRRMRIPFYCHPDHHGTLCHLGPTFTTLQAENLVRTYESGQVLTLGPGLRCRPLPLRHDGGATFGFRFEGSMDLFGQPYALGYAADLGSWTAELALALADVDLLALEFNHDVELERGSGRSPQLIARVLGDEGHLSNSQAAALLRQVLRLSSPGRTRHIVQLHLSRDCNRPTLAARAARAALADLPVEAEVHTAAQDVPGPTLTLGVPSKRARKLSTQAPRRKPFDPATAQPWLPGWEGC